MKEEAPRTLYGGIIKTGQTSQTQSNPIKLKQTDSNQIKPACCLLTSADTPEGLVVVRLLRLSRLRPGLAGIKANQTKSNQIKPVGDERCPEIGHAGRGEWKRPLVMASQESEQIKNGPLCGPLAPPETVKPSQTSERIELVLT
jgi:hypothetical protein